MGMPTCSSLPQAVANPIRSSAHIKQELGGCRKLGMKRVFPAAITILPPNMQIAKLWPIDEISRYRKQLLVAQIAEEHKRFLLVGT